MGLQGVEWTATKSDISDAIKKTNGVLYRTAQHLNIARYTLYRRIQEDEELQQLIIDIRNDYIEKKLDIAEETNLSAMEKRDKDMTNALKASFFVLNNLGKKRGYNHPRSNDTPASDNLEEIHEASKT
jgi:hypothetical protein